MTAQSIKDHLRYLSSQEFGIMMDGGDDGVSSREQSERFILSAHLCLFQSVHHCACYSRIFAGPHT